MQHATIHTHIVDGYSGWQKYIEADTFIETIEKRQGLKVACIEEIAYRMGYIDANQVKNLAQPLMKNGYGHYLTEMLKHEGGL